MSMEADPRRRMRIAPPPPQISRQPSSSSSSFNYPLDFSSYDPAFSLPSDCEKPSFKDFLEKTAPQYNLAPSSSISFSRSFDRLPFRTGSALNYSSNNNNNDGGSRSNLIGSTPSASVDDFLSTARRRNAEIDFDNREIDVNNFSRRDEIHGDDYYRRPSANATTTSSYLESPRFTSIEKESTLQTKTTTTSDFSDETRRTTRRIQVDSASVYQRKGEENISNNNKSLIDEIPEEGKFIETNVAIFRRKVTHVDGEIGFAGTDLFFHMR